MFYYFGVGNIVYGFELFDGFFFGDVNEFLV